MKIDIKKQEPEIATIISPIEPEVVFAKPAKISFEDKTPSNWVIIATEKGIEARNNASGEKFSGSIEDFNKALKN